MVCSYNLITYSQNTQCARHAHLIKTQNCLVCVCVRHVYVGGSAYRGVFQNKVGHSRIKGQGQIQTAVLCARRP